MSASDGLEALHLQLLHLVHATSLGLDSQEESLAERGDADYLAESEDERDGQSCHAWVSAPDAAGDQTDTTPDELWAADTRFRQLRQRFSRVFGEETASLQAILFMNKTCHFLGEGC